MVAVDTNIIVRLLTQDDELQYQKSLEIFQTQTVFIPDTVILETEWVLRFAYNGNCINRRDVPPERLYKTSINSTLIVKSSRQYATPKK
ncbi:MULTISPECIES: PIN domain-containing protein [Nostocales]|uniref:PIN domain-containing protein n=1 Tax=Nostocales TaxID=1161 RepID=UPI0004B8051E|nr:MULTISPECIES: PIN domain-containing protein [Nostocales]